MLKLENKTYSFFVLPIEFSARELDSKILLAYSLVSEGFDVILGQQWEIFNQLKTLPPSIILFKSHNEIYYSIMALAKKYGHYVIALEEESIADTQESALEKLSNNKIYNNVDCLFANGAFEANFHIHKRHAEIPLKIVGNPRIDLLKSRYRFIYQDRINEITSKYGDFILINTNFGITNSIWGLPSNVFQISIKSGFVKIDDNESIHDFKVLAKMEESNQRIIFDVLTKIPNHLSKLNIIIRPHPSEDLERAKQIYQDMRNVSVIRDGSHLPWTIASKCLIHASCTTGLEGVIAKKNVVGIIEEENWYTQKMLSNKVSHIAKTSDEVINFIENSISGLIYEKEMNSFENYILNINEKSSTDFIMTALKELNLDKSRFPIKLNLINQMSEIQRNKCNFSKEYLEKMYSHLNKTEKAMKKLPSIKQLAESLFLIEAEE